MVIVRSPCSGGPLWEGNRTWEADRWSGGGRAAKWRDTTDRERVSRSASEPDSASLRQVGVAKLPEMPKPVTCREATGVCTCRAPRGGWGRRARKDASRNLGGPLWPGARAEGRPGIHNREVCCSWESERPIVARKSWKQDGAKGPCCGQAESERECAAWTKVLLRNSWRFGDL